MRWLEEPPPSSALVVKFGNAHTGAVLGGEGSLLCVRLCTSSHSCVKTTEPINFRSFAYESPSLTNGFRAKKLIGLLIRIIR